MSVILTDVDIPKNCSECPCLHHGEYGAFEKSWCALDGELQIFENERPSGCGIKSMDGLIEKLEGIGMNQLRLGLSINDSFERIKYIHSAQQYKYIIQLIKEYCGAED